MDIGHLITFIVSFFTILLFRRIDKNKLQINKLKKFFEQTQQNFLSLAEKKDQHFKDNTIELDMLIEKSASIIEHINKQLKFLDEKSDELEGGQSVVTDLSARLDALKNISDEVENSIKDIQTEEKIIKNISENVKTLKSEVRELQSGVPKLKQELTSSFDKELKDKMALFDEKVMGWYNEQKAKFQASETEISQKLTKLETSISAQNEKHKADAHMLFSETQNKLDNFGMQYQAAINELTKNSKEGIEKLNENIEVMAANINDVENGIIENAKQSIKERTEESRKMIEAINAEISNVKNDVFQVRDNILDELHEKFSQFSTLVDNSKVKASKEMQLLGDKMSSLEIEYQRRLEDHIAKIQNRINSYENILENIDKNANEAEIRLLKELEVKLSKISENANDKLKLVDKSIREAENELGAKVISINGQIEDELGKMRKAISSERNDILLKYKETDEKLHHFVLKQKNDYAGEIENLKKLLSDEKDGMIRTYKGLEKKILSVSEKAESKIEKDVASFGDFVNRHKNEVDAGLKEYRSYIESLEAGASEHFDRIKNQIHAEFANNDNRIKEFNESFNKLVSGERAYQDEELKRIRIDFEAALSEANKTSAEELKEFSMLIAKQKSDVMTRFSEAKVQIDEIIKEGRIGVIKDIDTMKSYLEDEKASAIKEFKDSGSGIKTMLISLKANVEKDLQEITTSVSTKKIEISKNYKNLDNQISDFLENAKAKIAKESQSTLKSFEESRETISREIEGLKANLHNIESKLVQKVVNDLDVFKSNIDQDKNEIQKEIERLQGSLGDLNENLIETFNSTNSSFKEEIRDSKEAAFREMSLLKDNLENIKGIINERMNKEVDELRLQLQGEKGLLKKEVDAARGDLKAHYDTAVKQLSDEFKNVRSAIDDANKNVENIKEIASNSVERSTKVINELLGNREEAFNSRVDGLFAELSEKETDLNKRFSGIVNDLKSGFDRERDILGDELEKVKKDLSEKKKDVTFVVEDIKGSYIKDLDNLIMTMQSKFDKVDAEYMVKHKDLMKDTDYKIKQMSEELASVKANFKFVADKSLGEVEKRINDYRIEVSRSLEGLESQIKDKEIHITAGLDERREDLGRQLNEIENRIFNLREALIKDVGKASDSIKASFTNMEREYKERNDNFIYQSEQKMLALNDEIERIKYSSAEIENSLMQQVKDKIEDFRMRLSEELNAFDEMSLKKRSDVEKVFTDKMKDISNDITAFESQLVKIQDKIEAKTRDRLAELGHEINIMENQVEELKKEAKVFKRTDKLSEKVTADIERFNNFLVKIKDEKNDLMEFEKRMKVLQKENQLVNEHLSQLEQRKGEINFVNTRIIEVMNKSSELETKIAKVNKDASLVDRLEDKLDSLNNFYHELEDKLEGLNNKERELTDTISSMNEAESFAATLGEKLEELRHEFVQMDDRNGDIINRLKHVESNMQKIEGGEDLIEEAVSRFKEMDGYTHHIEERLNQLERARKRLDDMEVNLEKLSTATQTQIEKLMAASSIALDPHSGPLSDALPEAEKASNEKKDLVLKLHERSWTEDQIAKQLKMSVSEVKLIISSAKRMRQ